MKKPHLFFFTFLVSTLIMSFIVGGHALPITEKFFENHQISISNPYPYPANDAITFSYQIHQSSVEAKIIVYDVLGNTLGNYRLSNEYTKLIIQTSSLQNGIYFCTLFLDGKSIVTKKILVNH